MNKDQWVEWAKSDCRPVDIPSDAVGVYGNQGWIGWGDWLGTGRVSNQNMVYRPFGEARAFARNLGLKTQLAWRSWAKSDARPDDIPATPVGVYTNEGWAGWGDWLGVINQWNRNAVLSFLRSIEPIIPNLQPNELFAIMRQNGMIAASVNPSNSNMALIRSIRDLCSSPDPESDFEELVTEIEAQNVALDEEATDIEAEPTSEVVLIEEDAKEELPTLRSLTTLKAVDALVEAGITSDEETIEFLVANRVSGLWQAVLNSALAFSLDMLRAETGGTYFNAIRSRFLTQYDGAQSWRYQQVMISALKVGSLIPI